MKRVISEGGLLAAVLLACLGMVGCSGASTGGANNSAATTNAAANSSANATGSRSSEYPPLASGLANADFELLDGTKFKVTDKKGKVLLLNIWGTWCGPCREEMPHLVELQDKYGPQGFEVIGLNIGDGSGGPESNELIQGFVDKMKLNYTIARSPTSATVMFYQISKQQVVPQTLLIDRQGHLRGVFVGGGARVVGTMKSTLEKTMAEG